jgi:hypothetical protein
MASEWANPRMGQFKFGVRTHFARFPVALRLSQKAASSRRTPKRAPRAKKRFTAFSLPASISGRHFLDVARNDNSTQDYLAVNFDVGRSPFRRFALINIPPPGRLCVIRSRRHRRVGHRAFQL